jgi:hypothetical protein
LTSPDPALRSAGADSLASRLINRVRTVADRISSTSRKESNTS